MSEKATELVVVEAEYVELGSLKAAGPVAVVQQATAIATELAKIIDRQKLFSIIRRKKFVRVEGWNTLGAMVGVLPREVSSIRLEDGSYNAVVELIRTSDGAVIGRASAICGMDEKDNKGKLTWALRPEYARKSMATTRATGKVYRLGFSWIMALAGYEPTPAEEMPSQPQEQGQAVKPKGNGKAKRPLEPIKAKLFLLRKVAEGPAESPIASPKQTGLLAGKLEECFAPAADSTEKRRSVLKWIWKVDSSKELTKAQAGATLDWLLLDESHLHPDVRTYALHSAAPAEAAAILKEAMIETGQTELDLNTDILRGDETERNGEQI
jgi:hypothetical protein